MNKIAAILLVTICLGLCSCGNQGSFGNPYNVTVPTTAKQTEPKSSKATTAAPTTQVPTTAKVVVDKSLYQSDSVVVHDSDGYEYKITVQISPWIPQSDEAVLNAVWSDFRHKDSPPSLSDWRLKNENGRYKRTTSFGDAKGYFWCESSNFSMYYAVGTVRIDNVTQGFDITESNSKKVRINAYMTSDTDFYKEWDWGTRPYMIKYYYSDVEDLCFSYAGGAPISSTMQRNTWGPLTFVIMHGEASTPNNPDGKYRDLLETYKLEFSPTGYFLGGDRIEFDMHVYAP